jgi:hypothetical protein
MNPLDNIPADPPTTGPWTFEFGQAGSDRIVGANGETVCFVDCLEEKNRELIISSPILKSQLADLSAKLTAMRAQMALARIQFEASAAALDLGCSIIKKALSTFP